MRNRADRLRFSNWPGAAYLRTVLPYGSSKLVGQAGEFIGFVLLARHLGTSDFGVFSVAFLISRYAGIVGDWGAGLRGPRDVAIDVHPDHLHALVRRREIVSLALSLAFVVATLAVGRPELAPLAATIMARGISRDWLALGHERALRSGLPSVLQGGLAAVGGAVAWTLGSAAWVIAGAYLAGAVLSLALNPLPAGSRRGGVKVDGWLMLAVLSDQVYATADVLLLAWLVGTSDSGIYAAGYRIPNAWTTVLGLAVAGVLPRMTRTLHEQPDTAGWVRRRALRLGGSLAAFVLLLIPISWWAIPKLFGSDYSSGRLPVAILLVATAIATSTAFLAPMYFAFHSDRTLGLFTLGTAFVNVIGNLVLIPVLGMNGAAIATCASQAMVSVFLLVTTSAGRMARAVDPVA